MAALLFHLKNCPDDFLKPSVFSGGRVHTNALLMDVYRRVYGDKTVTDANLPGLRADSSFDDNHLLSVHIGCWVFSHPSFANGRSTLRGVENFLFEELAKLSPYVNAAGWIQDEDRAEEFLRLALQTCRLLPEDESEAEAADRLDALSTTKRRSVLQESNAALQRIKEIRQKMAEAKAREAANVYGRE